MGGGQPPSQNSNSTSTTQLPAWAQPYAQGFLGLSQNTYAPIPEGAPAGSPGVINPYPYPEQQVAPFSPLQQQGFDAIAAQGGSSPLVDQAMQYQSSVMNQNAIDNPLLAQYFNAAAIPMVQQYRNATAPGIASSALKAGAFGGSGHQQAMSDAEQNLGQGLSSLAAGIYEPAWNQQAQMQQQAAYMSPTLQQASYLPAQQLLQAGGAQQQQAQNQLNTAYQNQYAQAGWPYQALQGLGQGVNLALGGAGSTTTIQTKSQG